MKMTLKEFARMTGYSPSTISKALNNTSNCYTSEKVKENIRKKALELGYRPNLTARSLITHKNNTIGILLPSVGGFYTELVRNMEFALEKRKYFGLFAFWRPKDGNEGFRQAYERIIQRGIDGIITCHYTPWLKNSDIPLVVYGNTHDDVDYISIDKINYGRRAVDYLYKLGHRKIAYIGKINDLRCKSCRTALEAKGVSFNQAWACDCDMNLHGGESGAEEILKLDERPTAIIAHNDTIAYSIIHTLKKAGIRVPEDISVLGYDNLPEAEYYNPPLTTFDLDIERLADLLAETVLRRIENPDIPLQSVLIDPGIIERSSTGICK